MNTHKRTRRALVSGLGLGAVVLSARAARAQAPGPSGFRPARHEQDKWLDALPGQHRTIIDAVSSRGVGEALLFARNLYVANASDYGLKDADVAVVICLRHAATSLAFNDAMWSKYGGALAGREQMVDPKTGKAPTVNLYNTGSDGRGIRFEDVVARGTHFAVCSMATRRLSSQVATAAGISAEAAFKELTSNLVPNGHMVPAGVVAVTRAQEYGYTFLNAG
jgi:intracellular sulfur oxidation DsrE/DsrF family protein